MQISNCLYLVNPLSDERSSSNLFLKDRQYKRKTSWQFKSLSFISLTARTSSVIERI